MAATTALSRRLTNQLNEKKWATPLLLLLAKNLKFKFRQCQYSTVHLCAIASVHEQAVQTLRSFVPLVLRLLVRLEFDYKYI